MSFKLKVHAVPGASQNAIAGKHGDALKIRIHAQPEDGKANDELCIFVAQVLGVAKSNVAVAGGETSRAKTLLIEGIDETEAWERLLNAPF